MKNICQNCGNSFETPPSDKAKFCSRKCSCIFQKPRLGTGMGHIYKTCPICHIVFNNWASSPQKYCSRKCFSIFLGEKLKNRTGIKNPAYKGPVYLQCEYCGNDFIKKQQSPKFCSRKCMGESRKGPGNNQWTGGSERRSPYAYKYRIWRNAVLHRDRFTCQSCGSKENLHGHHIKSWAKYPNFRFDISNGLTLCERCHYSAHSKNFLSKPNIIEN